jgi:hypothetical protein
MRIQHSYVQYFGWLPKNSGVEQRWSEKPVAFIELAVGGQRGVCTGYAHREGFPQGLYSLV